MFSWTILDGQYFQRRCYLVSPERLPRKQRDLADFRVAGEQDVVNCLSSTFLLLRPVRYAAPIRELSRSPTDQKVVDCSQRTSEPVAGTFMSPDRHRGRRPKLAILQRVNENKTSLRRPVYEWNSKTILQPCYLGLLEASKPVDVNSGTSSRRSRLEACQGLPE